MCVNYMSIFSFPFPDFWRGWSPFKIHITPLCFYFGEFLFYVFSKAYYWTLNSYFLEKQDFLFVVKYIVTQNRIFISESLWKLGVVMHHSSCQWDISRKYGVWILTNVHKVRGLARLFSFSPSYGFKYGYDSWSRTSHLGPLGGSHKWKMAEQ